jgi:hypothetical protein
MRNVHRRMANREPHEGLFFKTIDDHNPHFVDLGNNSLEPSVFLLGTGAWNGSTSCIHQVEQGITNRLLPSGVFGLAQPFKRWSLERCCRTAPQDEGIVCDLFAVSRRP